MGGLPSAKPREGCPQRTNPGDQRCSSHPHLIWKWRSSWCWGARPRVACPATVWHSEEMVRFKWAVSLTSTHKDVLLRDPPSSKSRGVGRVERRGRRRARGGRTPGQGRDVNRVQGGRLEMNTIGFKPQNETDYNEK